MNNSDLAIRNRHNIIFLISLFVISLITLMILIFTLLINSPDNLDLKRPLPYLLLPIYLVIRLAFLKTELEKNITINRNEEIVKLLLFIYFLIIISLKFFPMDKLFSPELLSIDFFSFNSIFSAKFIIKAFIKNILLFIPIGVLFPIIINKFKKMYKTLILGFVISMVISIIQISLKFTGIYIVDIISLDLLLINILGTFIGYKIYQLIINYNKESSSLSKIIE